MEKIVITVIAIIIGVGLLFFVFAGSDGIARNTSDKGTEISTEIGNVQFNYTPTTGAGFNIGGQGGGGGD